jgi:hypothetical protein
VTRSGHLPTILGALALGFANVTLGAGLTSPPVSPVVSPALRHATPSAARAGDKPVLVRNLELPAHSLPAGMTIPKDTAVQQAAGPTSPSATGVNFDGVGVRSRPRERTF